MKINIFQGGHIVVNYNCNDSHFMNLIKSFNVNDETSFECSGASFMIPRDSVTFIGYSNLMAEPTGIICIK